MLTLWSRFYYWLHAIVFASSFIAWSQCCNKTSVNCVRTSTSQTLTCTLYSMSIYPPCPRPPCYTVQSPCRPKRQNEQSSLIEIIGHNKSLTAAGCLATTAINHVWLIDWLITILITSFTCIQCIPITRYGVKDNYYFYPQDWREAIIRICLNLSTLKNMTECASKLVFPYENEQSYARSRCRYNRKHAI